MRISTVLLSSLVVFSSAFSYADKSPQHCDKGYKSGEKKAEQSSGGKSGGYRVVTEPKHVSSGSKSPDHVYVVETNPSYSYYGGSYGYGPYYRPYPAPQPVYSPAPTAQMFFPETELGVRATASLNAADQPETLQSLGLYLRSHVRSLGFEVSVDGGTVLNGSTPVSNRASLLGAGMLYLTPEQSTIRVYGLLGGGFTAVGSARDTAGPAETLQTLQAGVGGDFTLSPKSKLHFDLRALRDFAVIDNAVSPVQDTVVANIGVGLTF